MRRFDHRVRRATGSPRPKETDASSADKLRDAGVPTTSVRFNGTIHDFMRLNALRDSESTRGAVDLAVAALRRAYGTD
jgi:acetyl esterase/lipase